MEFIKIELFEVNQGKEVIDEIVSSGFLKYDQIGPSFEDFLIDNNYFIEDLEQLRKNLDEYLSQISSNDAGFWKKVVEDGDLKSRIMAMLFYLMDSGSQLQVSFSQKRAAVLASNSYLAFLRVPGASGVQFFHPVIYQKALNILNVIHLLYPKRNTGKRSRDGPHQTQSQSSQSKRRRQSSKSPSQQQADTQSQFSDDFDDECDLSAYEISILRSDLLLMVQSLFLFLKSNSLKSHKDLSEQTVNSLASLTVVEPATFTTTFDAKCAIEKLNSFCHLAYLGIFMICCRNGAFSPESVKHAMRSLEKNLLMLVGERRDHPAPQSIPREVVMVRDQTLHFILYLMREGGENVMKPVTSLLQSVVLSTPDRSEYRSKVAEMCREILEKMTDLPYCHICKWIFLLSKYKKGSGRIMSVEIIGELVVSSRFRQIQDNNIDASLSCYTSRSVLMQALLTRCSDKIPSVMARALSTLAILLDCNQENVRQDVRSFLSCHKTKRYDTDNSAQSNSCLGPIITGSVDMSQTVSSSNNRGQSSTSTSTATGFHLTKGFNITLADTEGLISMIKRRMNTTKVVVRRSALQALESIIKLNKCVGMTKELDLLRDHCRDVAVPIRKQAMASLNLLIQTYPENQLIHRVWLDGILLSYDDNEASVQEKCWESVKSIMLDPLTVSVNTEKEKLVWSLVALVNSPDNVKLIQALHSVCVQLHKRANLSKDLVNIIIKHIDTSRSKEAWMLLSILCPVVSTTDSKIANLVAEYWLDKSMNLSQSDAKHVVLTLASLADHVEVNKRKVIVEDFMTRLKSYKEHFSSIKYMTIALSQLTADTDSGAVWAKEIISDIEAVILNLTCSESYDKEIADLLPFYLCTLAEVCLYNPHAVSSKLIQVIQSFVLLPKSSDTASVPSLIKDMANEVLPKSIRRFAIYCLGKICVQHELEAKQSIPALARELENSSDSLITTTIITILCDLCRLYTNAVGPYISCLSTCLRSCEALVRRTSFASMNRLLQEDFLKFKGPLFFRFISCITDSDLHMSDLAKQTFHYELAKRHKTLFSQHFVESVFHFNDCTGHKSYNKFIQTDAERKLFSLTGDKNSSKRHDIYAFMLTHMLDSEKFMITQKLCQDVLSAVVEDEMPLKSPAVASVLIDSLKILQSKDIKLAVTRSPAAGAEDPTEGTDDLSSGQINAKVKATSAAVTKILKKNFIETVMPDIIALKVKLESVHSPILRHLMLFLIEVTKDYKAELADIFSANPQLSAEIAFDIKKFEEMQALTAAQTGNESYTEADIIPTATPTTNDSSSRPAPKEPATPRNAAIMGTPAMPPPNLRSALKKPKTTAQEIGQSAKKILEEHFGTNSSKQIMKKKVNFNEEDEDEEEEAPNDVEDAENRSILRSHKSRAFSTPDGKAADLTFSKINMSLQRNLSPIVRIAKLDFCGLRHQNHQISHSTTQHWNVKSPLAKSNTRKQLVPDDNVHVARGMNTRKKSSLNTSANLPITQLDSLNSISTSKHSPINKTRNGKQATRPQDSSSEASQDSTITATRPKRSSHDKAQPSSKRTVKKLSSDVLFDIPLTKNQQNKTLSFQTSKRPTRQNSSRK